MRACLLDGFIVLSNDMVGGGGGLGRVKTTCYVVRSTIKWFLVIISVTLIERVQNRKIFIFKSIYLSIGIY